MEIRNIRHKHLRNFLERDEHKGLPTEYIDKIRDILTFLLDIQSIDEIESLKKYKPHILKGNRAGVYSLTVSSNWRITFEYDSRVDQIYNLDFEDYH